MTWTVLADDLGFTEGPVALADGRVALVSISHGCVYIVDPAGAPTERIDVGGGPNGLAVDNDGTLYVAQNGGVWGGFGPAPAGIQVIQGGNVEYLIDGLGAPNDLAFGPDGRLWVTDTVAEFPWGEPDKAQPGKIYAVDVATGDADLVLDEGPLFLNGLAFAGDGSQLLVTATIHAQVISYELTADTLGPPEVLHQFDGPANPDGMCRIGDLFCVALLGADRVDLVGAAGTVQRSVDLPSGTLPTNVCADHEGSGLYVTGGFAQGVLHLPRRP